MKIKMNDKRWAKHIIKRFGKEEALIYAYKIVKCPCKSLNRNCNDCKYSRKKYIYEEIPHCKKGKIYYKMWMIDPFSFSERVKKIIRERLEKK